MSRRLLTRREWRALAPAAAAAAIGLLLLLAGLAHAQEAPPVDPNPTVGVANSLVTDANLASTVCEKPPVPRPAKWKSWIQRERPPSAFTTRLKREQLPPGADLSLYEQDHAWPLEIGGAPRDPANLRPQAWAGPDGAHAKDQVEDAAHRALCAGTINLAQAHARVAAWILAHHPYPVVQAGAPR